MRYLRRVGTLALAAVAVATASTAALHAETQVKESQISFSPNTIVEAAFFRVGEGKQEELNQRYLSKVLPLAQSFGMKPLGFFGITRVSNGPDDASLWGLFEWPDLDSRRRFESDPRFIQLREIRDELMDSFKIVHLRAKEAFTLTVRGDRMYEFSALWMNRAHASHIQRYLDAAEPFGQQHGVRLIDRFEVVGTSDRYPFLPEQVFIIEWPSEAVKSEWVSSDAFQAAGWNRALAIDQLYSVESRFVFP
jgi:uncharacterized protein (DUF1330 family)